MRTILIEVGGLSYYGNHDDTNAFFCLCDTKLREKLICVDIDPDSKQVTSAKVSIVDKTSIQLPIISGVDGNDVYKLGNAYINYVESM